MSAPQRPPWRPGPPARPTRGRPGRPGASARPEPRTLRTLRLVRDTPAVARGADADGPFPAYRRWLVGLARLLSGGLLALALTVAVLPPLLGDGGPGLDVVAAHVVAAAVALVATVVAGRRGTPPVVGVVAGLAVPAVTFGLLAGYWWA